MTNNNWLPDNLRDEWNKAKADAEAHRAEVEKACDPGQWTDAQHDAFVELVNRAREKSKNGRRMTKAEAEALKQLLKNPDKWAADVRADIANRREDATPNVRSDGEGGYIDRYGRPCDKDGY